VIEIALFTLTSFAVGLSGALVPGPMLTITISDSVKKGFIAGPLVVMGHFIVEIALIIFIMAGFSWLIGSATVAIIIGTLGGIMLIYMGYKTSRSSVEFQEITNNPVSSSRYGSVVDGIITSVSNPYFFIWWATIGWAFLFRGLEIAGIIGLIGFLIGHWSADLGWMSTVSFFSSKGSKIMSQNQYTLIMKICGVFLIILGLYFLIKAQISTLNNLFGFIF
jgi:threonine/homoserine/homoserine lactone efflux protein